MISPRTESMFLINKRWHMTIPPPITPLDTCWQEVCPPFPIPAPYTLEQITSFDQLLLHLTFQEVTRVLFPLKDQRCTAALKSAFLQHLYMLLLQLHAKSPGLYYHSIHVLHITCTFTRMLHLPQEVSAMIQVAALFHDIGKVYIADALLQKPSQLTLEEFEEVKKHSTHGTWILLHLRPLRDAASMVFHHHERWDGRGYPLGLQEKAIPLGARIIAAADAFAVMTSERAYRTPFSTAQALAELSRCAGTQFDPLLVEHFCANWESVGLD